MGNYTIMTIDFEKEKNIKASAITAVICSLLFLLFFFLQWSLPQIPEPAYGEGIEVNLGNSETGLGDVPPQIPGEPSATEEVQTSPATSSPVTNQANITGDENEADDAPVVNKAVIKPVTKPVSDIKPAITKPTTTNNAAPVPPAPKPKAIFKGGTTAGTGGNRADSYNGIRDQGIAGGKGDQGNPNGNPNSDSYTGNAASGNGGAGGNGGVSIRNGLDGRRITKLPSFEDDFNENAKVAVDITVDKLGNVTVAVVNPRGTTTTNQNIRNIALRKARSLKLNTGTAEEQTGTLVFSFRLRG